MFFFKKAELLPKCVKNSFSKVFKTIPGKKYNRTLAQSCHDSGQMAKRIWNFYRIYIMSSYVLGRFDLIMGSVGQKELQNKIYVWKEIDVLLRKLFCLSYSIRFGFLQIFNIKNASCTFSDESDTGESLPNANINAYGKQLLLAYDSIRSFQILKRNKL